MPGSVRFTFKAYHLLRKPWLIITYRRSRLLSNVVEACELLRNWYGKPRPIEVVEGGTKVAVELFNKEAKTEKQ